MRKDLKCYLRKEGTENVTDTGIILNAIVVSTCPECKKESLLEVNKDDLDSFMIPSKEPPYLPKKAQDAFPYLNRDQRELLLSGYCIECWDKIMKDE